MTKGETLAYERQNILLEMTKRGLTPTQYVNEYNTGKATVQKSIPRLSVPTLYRWKRRYNDGGIVSITPRYHPSGGGGRSLSKEDKELIQTYYFDENRPTLAHILRQIQRYHEREIDYSTALRYVHSIPEAIRILKRDGKKAYNDKAAAWIQRNYTDLYPMQMVSADHHTLDLLCRHPRKGTPFRPWLTVIMDYRSRKPLGWTIGITPTRHSILRALETCVENYGVPEEIHVDHGKDFRSKLLNGEYITAKNDADPFGEEQTIELQGVFGRLGTSVHFAAPYHPQAKPVERFFRVVSETFSKEFPSYVGSNTSDRPEDIALYYRRIKGQEKRGDLLELGDVSALFDLWVARYSEEHKHRGDGMDGRTPNQVFESEAGHPRPVMPSELRDLIFADVFKRTITRRGIHIEGTNYYAPEIVAHLSREIIARRPYRKHGTIIVFDLEGRRLLTAYDDYLTDTRDARENSKLRGEVNKKQIEILSHYLVQTTARKSLLDDLPEAQKAVGSSEDVISIEAYKPEKSELQSKFFEGVLKWRR